MSTRGTRSRRAHLCLPGMSALSYENEFLPTLAAIFSTSTIYLCQIAIMYVKLFYDPLLISSALCVNRLICSGQPLLSIEWCIWEHLCLVICSANFITINCYIAPTSLLSERRRWFIHAVFCNSFRCHPCRTVCKCVELIHYFKPLNIVAKIIS